MWMATVCLVSVGGVVDPAVGLGLVLAVLVGYGFVLAAHGSTLRRLPLPRRWVTWLGSAVDEEELELVVAIRPKGGTFGTP